MFWRPWKRHSSEPVSTPKRMMIAIAAMVQFALLAAAQADLLKRPASAVRGSKWMWRAISLVNFVGPIAYFLLGRREPEEPSTVVSFEAAAH